MSWMAEALRAIREAGLLGKELKQAQYQIFEVAKGGNGRAADPAQVDGCPPAEAQARLLDIVRQRAPLAKIHTMPALGRWLKQHGMGPLASRVSRLSKGRNISCHPDVALEDDLQRAIAALTCDAEGSHASAATVAHVAQPEAVEVKAVDRCGILGEQDNEQQTSERVKAGTAKESLQKVEAELLEVSGKVLDLLDGDWYNKASIGGKVSYHKTKADCYRCIAGFTDGLDKANAAESARLAYDEASKAAEQGLAATHPIRLGLALTLSVFQYEMLSKPDSEFPDKED